MSCWIAVQCIGNEAHRQVVPLGDCVDTEFAGDMAALMDGTSLAYVFPPGADSPIGKCGVCGAQIRCSAYDGDAPLANAARKDSCSRLRP